jgi:hypothetical protein
VSTVFIPTILRKYADNAAIVQVPGATLRELIENLETRHPGLKEHLVDANEPDALIPGLAASTAKYGRRLDHLGTALQRPGSPDGGRRP